MWVLKNLFPENFINAWSTTFLVSIYNIAFLEQHHFVKIKLTCVNGTKHWKCLALIVEIKSIQLGLLAIFRVFVAGDGELMLNCFCRMVFSLIFSLDRCQRFSPLHIWHAVTRISTCAEPKFRFYGMKFCSGDNQHTSMAPGSQIGFVIWFFKL